jgi:hypothetical protein
MTRDSGTNRGRSFRGADAEVLLPFLEAHGDG